MFQRSLVQIPAQILDGHFFTFVFKRVKINRKRPRMTNFSKNRGSLVSTFTVYSTVDASKATQNF